MACPSLRGSPGVHFQLSFVGLWRVRVFEGAPPPGPINGRNLPALTIAEVIHRYRAFAKTYYIKDRRLTKEYICMKYALRLLRTLFGQTQAADFGPLALKAVRQSMVDTDLSRRITNRRVNRVKRFFKWAASEELVSDPAGFLNCRRFGILIALWSPAWELSGTRQPTAKTNKPLFLCRDEHPIGYLRYGAYRPFLPL